MTEFVIGPGGTVIPADKVKDRLDSDGGHENNEPKKRNYYQELATSEKLKVNNFMKAHPELRTLNGLPSPEREKRFKEQAAKELINLRDVEKERFDAGKPPLTRKEKELVLAGEGVIRSVYRDNETKEIQYENAKASNLRHLDDLGYGQE